MSVNPHFQEVILPLSPSYFSLSKNLYFSTSPTLNMIDIFGKIPQSLWDQFPFSLSANLPSFSSPNSIDDPLLVSFKSTPSIYITY
jgi:hypothetical protein